MIIKFWFSENYCGIIKLWKNLNLVLSCQLPVSGCQLIDFQRVTGNSQQVTLRKE